MILSLLGAPENSGLFFTGGRGEANFHVHFASYLDFMRESGRTHFHILEGDHPSLTESIKRLEVLDLKCRPLPVNFQGQLTKQILLEELKPRSSLLSLSWASDLTGVIHPIHDLIEACREKGVLLHVDATPVLGKIYLILDEVDFLTLELPQSSLLVSKHPLRPLYFGSREPDLDSIRQALEEANARLEHFSLETARLRNLLEEQVKSALPDMEVFFSSADRLPHCTALGFPGIHSELLTYHLNRLGIHPTPDQGRLKKELQAAGIDSFLAQTALSFALTYTTCEEEIHRISEGLISSVKKLQPLSRNLSFGLIS